LKENKSFEDRAKPTFYYILLHWVNWSNIVILTLLSALMFVLGFHKKYRQSMTA